MSLECIYKKSLMNSIGKCLLCFVSIPKCAGTPFDLCLRGGHVQAPANQEARVWRGTISAGGSHRRRCPRLCTVGGSTTTAMLKLSSKAGAVSRPLRTTGRRTFATVQDPPVRRYGGLKDQDRIFTNLYTRHDHGLKGAQVRLFHFTSFGWTSRLNEFVPSLAATGIERKTSCSRATHGSFKP